MSRHISAIPAAVIDDPSVTDGMLRMLLVLGAYANRDGWCWPKLETIAGRLNVEKPAVSKMLSKLREAGYLDVHYEVREGRRRCVFRVLYDRPTVTAGEIDDDEYAAGLVGTPQDSRVSLKETQETSLPVSSKETQPTPPVSLAGGLKETDSFPPEGNGPLITSPVEQTRTPTLADASGATRVIEAWNGMAATAGLPRARLTPKRGKVIATRLREFGWLEDFTTACTAIAASPFHRGANDRAWMATIDFVLRPGKATELAERAAAAGRAEPARAPAAGGAPVVTVGQQPLTALAFWELCVSGGLTSAMQSRATIDARIQTLHAAGRVRDPALFGALVLHVQPWSLAEIKYAKERDERIALALSSWRPAA